MLSNSPFTCHDRVLVTHHTTIWGKPIKRGATGEVVRLWNNPQFDQSYIDIRLDDGQEILPFREEEIEKV